MSQLAANGGQPQKSPKYAPNFIPLKGGDTFGNWTVRRYVGKGVYNCECICGVSKDIVSTTLKNGTRKACRSCSSRRPDSGFRGVSASYRTNASRRGLKFNLPEDCLRQLFGGNCFFCGAIPNMERARFVYNGIDRLDNSIGYVLSNCVSCCKICNHMKHVLAVEDFLAHVRRITERQDVTTSC